VGTPRFTPARLFADPRDFGRDSLANPVSPSVLDPVEVAWAWFQHRACLAICDQLYYRGLSVAEFADALGADVAWLTRKLHGQTPASLGDLLEWSLYFEESVLPPIVTFADLVPTGGDQ
jgi:ligand-binding SRPBCC domain-containing protein